MITDTNAAAVAVAQATQPYVVEERRVLHGIPEVRYATDKTRYLIRHRLLDMGFQELGGEAVSKTGFREFPGGIVLDIHYAGASDRLLFRADFDALPVTEATGLEFASKIPGQMHACGHDVHTAMLLGFVKLVAEGKVQPRHDLRIVFQDAEENPGTQPEPISGGDLLVQGGVCDGVSSAHMMHIWATGKAGVFSSRPGAMLGNSGRIKFMIKATGGHAAFPNQGSSALRVTQAIQNALDSFATRHLPPTEPVALEPVILKSGTGSNVRPADAELWYGCRTMLPRDQHVKFMDDIEAEVKLIVARFPGASVEVTKINGHPALINDEREYLRVKLLLRDAGQATAVEPQLLGGEDFAHYLYKVPGTAWMLGANQPGCGGHHAPTFNPDESVFWRGVLLWILLATN